MSEDQAYDRHWSCDECCFVLVSDPNGVCKGCDDGSNFMSAKEQGQPKSKQRGQALVKALEIINGERQDSYGNPEDSFALIAEYWNVYLIELQKKVLREHGFDPDDYQLVDMLEARHIAEMMTLFKISRMSGQKATGDNYADAAGYIALAGDMI